MVAPAVRTLMLEPLAVEDPEQDLVLLGLAQQVGVHLDPHPDPVRLDEVGRERMVGVDGDLAADVGRGVGERLADPGLQLAGRLVGEGQAEHGGRRDPEPLDQVDDAGGHDRGLARPRAGDHMHRAHGGRDRRDLLGVGSWPRSAALTPEVTTPLRVVFTAPSTAPGLRVPGAAPLGRGAGRQWWGRDRLAGAPERNSSPCGHMGADGLEGAHAAVGVRVGVEGLGRRPVEQGQQPPSTWLAWIGPWCWPTRVNRPCITLAGYTSCISTGWPRAASSGRAAPPGSRWRAGGAFGLLLGCGVAGGLVVEQHDAAVRSRVDPVDAATDQVVPDFHPNPDLEPQRAAGGVGLAAATPPACPCRRAVLVGDGPRREPGGLKRSR